MNINLFFIVLLMLLMSVYVFFKPLKIDVPDHKEIAQLELKDFQIYEIEEQGVKSILEGAMGERFENRYEMSNVTFKDTSKQVIEVMHADHGRYQDDTVYLTENVIYAQDGGMTFKSDEAQYDINNSLLTTQGTFVMNINGGAFEGEKLKFNTKENKMLASSVRGFYNLEQK
jgi:LPS export ABC transporter protein LptC